VESEPVVNKEVRLLGDLLRQRAADTPTAPFVSFGDNLWYSYEEIDRRSDKVAAGLAASGVTAGDRVGIIAANRVEMVDTIFGCAKLGAIEVPISTWLKGEFLRHQIEDADPAVVIADGPGRDALNGLPGKTALQTIALDDAPADVASFRDLLEHSGPTPQPILRPSDILAILYTSGTTGMPKGCMLSNGYFTTAPEAYVRLWGIRRDDRVMTALPLFHAGGQLIAMMNAMLAGASIMFEVSFSASKFMHHAAATGATILIGVGPMAKAILAQPERPEDHENSLRLANFTPLDAAARAAFEERFGTTVIIEGYGQTECAPSCLGSADLRQPTTAAPPAPHLEVAVVDELGYPVPPGTVGEIVVRSRVPQGMYSGYWRRPEATIAASENLWHHTGDNGVADAQGFVRFVDRRSDSVRRRGENVSSIELEMAITTIPGVVQVAVTAVPSPLGEDDIKATIVWDGVLPEPAALFDALATRIPYYAVPRYVEFRVQLPTTVTGRVQKHLLRAEKVPDGTIDFEALGLSIPAEQRRRV
jgi:carnitine-CoA ligase